MRKVTTANSFAVSLPECRVLEINAGHRKGGCYVEILNRLNDQMVSFLSHHNKMLCLRMDIRLFDYTDKNKIMSVILRKLNRWLGVHYNTKRMGYLWVRECDSVKWQHYHLFLMVDGNKMQQPHKLIKEIERQCINRGLCKPYTPLNCYTMVLRNDNTSFETAFYRASYLAKVRSKSPKNSSRTKATSANNFSTSRIKLKTHQKST